MKRPDNPKLGTAYKVSRNSNDCECYCPIGENVYLIEDDGSSCPWFSRDKNCRRGRDRVGIGFSEYAAYRWSDLEPLDYPPLKEAKYKIRVTPDQKKQIFAICERAGFKIGVGPHAQSNKWVGINQVEVGLYNDYDFEPFTSSPPEISAEDFIRIYGAKRAFQVGDVVKVVKTREQKDTPLIGETGEITDTNTSENVIDVRFYKKHGLDTSDRVDDYTYMLYKSDLELITPVEEKEPVGITVDKQFIKGYERYLSDKKPETNYLGLSATTTCGALTPDSMRDAYQYLLREPMKPVYVGWDFGINTTTGKQPRKGIMDTLRSIPKKLQRLMDKGMQARFQLGRLNDRLELTSEGQSDLMDYLADLHADELGKRAIADLKEVKKARKESEEE